MTKSFMSYILPLKKVSAIEHLPQGERQNSLGDIKI